MSNETTGNFPLRRRSKSNKLTKEEHKHLKVLLKDSYVGDLAKLVGVTSRTIHNVKLIGSGSFETIQKIREVLNQSK